MNRFKAAGGTYYALFELHSLERKQTGNSAESLRRTVLRAVRLIRMTTSGAENGIRHRPAGITARKDLRVTTAGLFPGICPGLGSRGCAALRSGICIDPAAGNWLSLKNFRNKNDVIQANQPVDHDPVRDLAADCSA
jgi:hypothetical protein